MWKVIFESVPGTSHQQQGVPCQDACRVLTETVAGEDILIAVGSDGAGSAENSHIGAQLTCEVVATYFRDLLRNGVSLPSLGRQDAVEACHRLRLELRNRAQELQAELRSFACTLLVAIAGEKQTVCFQIGDGGIVQRSRAGDLSVVFWPQTGEFANTTYFVTDERFAKHLVDLVTNEPIHDLAMFTDGLERLVLKFDERRAHTPFFQPLFETIRSEHDVEELFDSLRDFLDSPAVNDRTDDDKTLILACRQSESMITKSGEASNEVH